MIPVYSHRANVLLQGIVSRSIYRLYSLITFIHVSLQCKREELHIKHTIENCYIIFKNENNTNKMFTFNWTIYKLEKNYILVYIYIFVIIKIKLSRTYFIAKFDFSEISRPYSK